jgi:hypothetical protein
MSLHADQLYLRSQRVVCNKEGPHLISEHIIIIIIIILLLLVLQLHYGLIKPVPKTYSNITRTISNTTMANTHLLLTKQHLKILFLVLTERV